MTGLDTPLVFSTLALDFNSDECCASIRDFVERREIWLGHCSLTSPLALAGSIKWALGRLANRGERSLVSLGAYQAWAMAERACCFSSQYGLAQMLSVLPEDSSQLLVELLRLCAAVAGYASKNGMSLRKLASIFALFVFGLGRDHAFDPVYERWRRSTLALEHLMLAHVSLKLYC